ncbi:MAG: group 1 truncated hemoglobin [Gammaproteobacteria bacterium]|nr:group 1 truncated hemoglobin [Gammaproteobacteria bacterium]
MGNSLYEDIGGLSTLEKVHRIFYDKIYDHSWLKKFFESFDQQVIEDKQTSFMGEKFGGPAYTGKPLKQVHENMYISQELADIRHKLLRDSLIEAELPEELADRWLRIDDAFMQQVVKKSIASFYRDYRFKYKQRIIHPEPR